jgi:hypothetical protein
MIQSEQDLRHSIESMAKMYSLCDRFAAQTIGDPETREDEIEGTKTMIHKIEREIAEYLAKKYNLARELEVVAA